MKMGAVAGSIVSIVAVIGFIWPVIADPLPLAGQAKLNTLAQNLSELQQQSKKLEQQIEQNSVTQTSLALMLYKQQLDQARAQMAVAAKRGMRDLAAEALRDNAETAIMTLTQQSRVR